MACISIRNKTVPPSGFSAVSPSGWLLFSFESGSSLTGNSNAFEKRNSALAVNPAGAPFSMLILRLQFYRNSLALMAGENSRGFSSLQLKRKLRARRMRPLTTILFSWDFFNPLLNMFFNLVPDHFRGLDGGECFNGCVCHCFVLLFFYSALLFVKVFPSFLYCFRILKRRKETGRQLICLYTIKQFI